MSIHAPESHEKRAQFANWRGPGYGERTACGKDRYDLAWSEDPARVTCKTCRKALAFEKRKATHAAIIACNRNQHLPRKP